jgi:23S rRNA (guanosine2251-2'-O)-methyltransferase
LEKVLENLQLSGKTPFLLLLDKITDVRNFGAIARTSECAGIDAIVVPAKNAAPLNVDAMKTSAGALNYVPVCRTPNLKSAIYLIKNYDIKIVAATEKANKNCFDADLSGAIAIILGSEESGISESNLELADETVKIPLQGNIDSLNVSAAAAVLAFECLRQRAETERKQSR